MKQRFIFVLIVACYFINLIYYYFILLFENINEDEIAFFDSKSIKKSFNCNPIYNSNKQYSVKINGVNYPKFVPLYQNKSINFDCLNSLAKNKPPKRILLWNKFFGSNYDDYGLGKKKPFIQHQCPVNNCELTMDKTLVNHSDFVVVHMMIHHDPIDKFPAFRPPNQRWIFLMFEPPVHTSHDDDFLPFESVFNLTATYKRNSDFNSVYYSFSRFEWGKNNSFNSTIDYHGRKTKFAVALISNCEATSERLRYKIILVKYKSCTF